MHIDIGNSTDCSEVQVEADENGQEWDATNPLVVPAEEERAIALLLSPSVARAPDARKTPARSTFVVPLSKLARSAASSDSDIGAHVPSAEHVEYGPMLPLPTSTRRTTVTTVTITASSSSRTTAFASGELPLDAAFVSFATVLAAFAAAREGLAFLPIPRATWSTSSYAPWLFEKMFNNAKPRLGSPSSQRQQRKQDFILISDCLC